MSLQSIVASHVVTMVSYRIMIPSKDPWRKPENVSRAIIDFLWLYIPKILFQNDPWAWNENRSDADN